MSDAIKVGRLSNLRRVDVADSCGWGEISLRHEVVDLAESLKLRAEQDKAEGCVVEESIEHGLYTFDDGL